MVHSQSAFFTRSEEGDFEAEESAQDSKKRNVSSTKDAQVKGRRQF